MLSRTLYSRVQAAKKMALEVSQLVDTVKSELETAQEKQKRYFDSQHYNIAFQVGQNVLLSTKHLDLSGLCKLSHKWIGPFYFAQQIGQVAYKLTLPQTLVGFHPVFYVYRLKPYVQGGGDGTDLGFRPGTVMVDAQTEYKVDYIL